MFTSRLLFLALLLVPAALHADDTVNVSGSGDYSCTFANVKLIDNFLFSFTGQVTSSPIDAYQNEPGSCAAFRMTPIDVSGATTSFGVEGDVYYAGVTYAAGSNCEELSTATQQFIMPCQDQFIVDQNGSLSLTFTSVYPYPYSSVQFIGSLTSVSGYVCDNCAYDHGAVAVDESFGTFDISSSPEPATWLLMLSAAPLFAMRMRSRNYDPRKEIPAEVI